MAWLSLDEADNAPPPSSHTSLARSSGPASSRWISVSSRHASGRYRRARAAARERARRERAVRARARRPPSRPGSALPRAPLLPRRAAARTVAGRRRDTIRSPASPRRPARRRHLVELRGDELAFTLEETRALLLAAGACLSDQDLTRLHTRTEGWPAGLYLAALSLRNRADAGAFVDAFVEGHRHIVDFLTEDVLARERDQVVRFLLRTSVLDRFCAPLCDAALESDDAALVLAELDRSNLFLVALDERRQWYRYHRLFRDLLAPSCTGASPTSRRSSTGAPRSGTSATGRLTKP